MRMARLKGHADEPAAFYHCISRVVDRRFAFGNAEKESFVKIMRGYEDFCGKAKRRKRDRHIVRLFRLTEADLLGKLFAYRAYCECS